MISLLGGKLKAAGIFLIGFLLMALALAGRAIEKLKREKVEQELEDEKATSELSDRVTEVIVRGVANEQSNESVRNHKFGDNS